MTDPQSDPIMDQIVAAVADAQTGKPDEARDEFARLWSQIGESGDPFYRVTIAHYMADLQGEPADELWWDLEALRAADELTDDRAQQHHASLQVAAFYPSLHLNAGESYRNCGDLENARDQLELAQACLDRLPNDGYGDMIRGGIARLRDRLDAVS